MCLAVPGKIIRIEKNIAIVDYGSERRTAKIINPVFKLGEYVIVQGGFVIDTVPKNEAESALKLYHEALKP